MCSAVKILVANIHHSSRTYLDERLDDVCRKRVIRQVPLRDLLPARIRSNDDDTELMAYCAEPRFFANHNNSSVHSSLFPISILPHRAVAVCKAIGVPKCLRDIPEKRIPPGKGDTVLRHTVTVLHGAEEELPSYSGTRAPCVVLKWTHLFTADRETRSSVQTPFLLA